MASARHTCRHRGRVTNVMPDGVGKAHVSSPGPSYKRHARWRRQGTRVVTGAELQTSCQMASARHTCRHRGRVTNVMPDGVGKAHVSSPGPSYKRHARWRRQGTRVVTGAESQSEETCALLRPSDTPMIPISIQSHMVLNHVFLLISDVRPRKKLPVLVFC